MPYINSLGLKLRKVYVIGSASPEGPYRNNLRLGNERAGALLKELSADIINHDPQTQLSVVAEDYEYLCYLMEKAGDKDAPVVRGIFEECHGDAELCKERLMGYRNGLIWNRIYNTYFPELRSAKIILWLSEPGKRQEPEEQLEPEKQQEPETIVINPIEQPVDTVAYIATVEDKVQKPSRQRVVAIRTNLVHDAFYMPGFGWAPSPNLQLEFFPKEGHWTYNIAGTWGTVRKWDQQQFWQVRDFQFEARRYFKGQAQYKGLYLSAYAHANVYGIGLDKDRGWQGEGAGTGLGLGYVLPLNRKGNLKMEFSIAAGYYFSRFDPYVYGNPVTGTIDGYYYYNYLGNADTFKERNHVLNWFGPTNLGISLAYDIIYRKVKQ